MENGSLFWNKTANLFADLGLPYITELEAILIILAVFFVLFFLLWLVFRKARLWYWKTNIQIDTLKSIDVRLHHVEEKLSQCSERAADQQEAVAAEDTEPLQKTVQASAEKEDLFAIGKSGKIYTEAELELLIRE